MRGAFGNRTRFSNRDSAQQVVRRRPIALSRFIERPLKRAAGEFPLCDVLLKTQHSPPPISAEDRRISQRRLLHATVLNVGPCKVSRYVRGSVIARVPLTTVHHTVAGHGSTPGARAVRYAALGGCENSALSCNRYRASLVFVNCVQCTCVIGIIC